MKKLLVAVLLLGGGWYAYAHYLQPEQRACVKMASLCDDKSGGVDQCEADLKDMRKAMGADTVRKFDACVADAKSCPEAAGCMLGAAGSGVGDMMNKFIQGVGKGIAK